MIKKSFREYLEEQNDLKTLKESSQDRQTIEKNLKKMLSINAITPVSVKAFGTANNSHIEIDLKNQKDYDKTMKLLKDADLSPVKVGSGFVISANIK